jgi:hypothetical protein
MTYRQRNRARKLLYKEWQAFYWVPYDEWEANGGPQVRQHTEEATQAFRDVHAIGNLVLQEAAAMTFDALSQAVNTATLSRPTTETVAPYDTSA